MDVNALKNDTISAAGFERHIRGRKGVSSEARVNGVDLKLTPFAVPCVVAILCCVVIGNHAGRFG